MNTCILDDLSFPYTKFKIKDRMIKIEFSFLKQKYPGLFHKIQMKCFPLFFEKNEGKVLHLTIAGHQYKVVWVDHEFEEDGIHLDPDTYEKEKMELYKNIVDDPAPLIENRGLRGANPEYKKNSKEWKDAMKCCKGSGYIVFKIIQ